MIACVWMHVFIIAHVATHQCIYIDVPADLARHNTQFMQVQTPSTTVGTLQQLTQVRPQLFSCPPLKLRRGQSRTEQSKKRACMSQFSNLITISGF